jgi:plastocyanin
MTFRLKSLLAITALACMGLLAACGSDDSSSSSSSSSSSDSSSSTAASGDLTVTADKSGQLAWDPTELTAKAGKVTVTLDNPSPVAHDIQVEGGDVEETSDLVTAGKTSLSLDLKPGTYEYYCTVPGHKDAGMDGTLTVQ